MKRSRRVVLTMMGGAATAVSVGAVSMGIAAAKACGPGLEAIPGPDHTSYCRAIHGGFGGSLHRVSGYGNGHAHGGG